MKIEHCLKLSQLAQETALQTYQRHVSIAISNKEGDLLFFIKMDEAPIRTIAIAQAKAYTAARMETSTKLVKQRLKDEELQIIDFMDPKLCALPGGVPIICEQKGLIGALGISGLKLEDDHELASTVASLYESFV